MKGMAQTMVKVTVYEFEAWNEFEDANQIAPRMATAEAIVAVGGQVIEGSEREIESSLLDDNGFADPTIRPLDVTDGGS